MLDEKFRKFDNESLSGVFFLFVLHGPIDVFRFEQQIVDSISHGIGDGIADSSACRRETRLTHAFGPMRAVAPRTTPLVPSFRRTTSPIGRAICDWSLRKTLPWAKSRSCTLASSIGLAASAICWRA